VFSVFCFDFVFCFICFVLAFGLRTDVFLLTFGSRRVKLMQGLSFTDGKNKIKKNMNYLIS
jgi:hypothetical protein